MTGGATEVVQVHFMFLILILTQAVVPLSPQWIIEPFIYERHDVLMPERFDYCSCKTAHKVGPQKGICRVFDTLSISVCAFSLLLSILSEGVLLCSLCVFRVEQRKEGRNKLFGFVAHSGSGPLCHYS